MTPCPRLPHTHHHSVDYELGKEKEEEGSDRHSDRHSEKENGSSQYDYMSSPHATTRASAAAGARGGVSGQKRSSSSADLTMMSLFGSSASVKQHASVTRRTHATGDSDSSVEGADTFQL